MDIKTAIKTANQAAGKNDCDISKFLNIAAPSYSAFINGNLRQVERIIKILNFCGCDLIITDHKNINIKLTEK